MTTQLVFCNVYGLDRLPWLKQPVGW